MEKLSIIIPVYNEIGTIGAILKKVKDVPLNAAKEIIIVDDASKDGTADLLKKIKDSSIKIFFHQKNQGKGAAIRTGLKYATGDVMLIQDADLEYDPKEYPVLLKPILDNQTKVVYGTRMETIKKNMSKMYKLHYFGNIFLTLVTNVLYGTKISDMETGYKVFRKEVLEGINLRARRFDFEPEITAKILKKGYKIVEVPIGFTARSFEEGKKITWRDGVKALFYLVRYRFFD